MSFGASPFGSLPFGDPEQASASGASGTIAVTNANDTASASGTTTVVGTSATTNANDAASSSGTTTVVGTSATTNANDTSSASGTVGGGADGTIDVTNENDTANASGWSGTVTGTIAVTNADDIALASGETPYSQETRSGRPHLGQFYTRKEREEYVKRQRQLMGIIPKDIKPVVRKLRAIARKDNPPPIEQIPEFNEFKDVEQPVKQALDLSYRLYLSLLIEDAAQREKTRQFIDEQIAIVQEQQRKMAEYARMIQEEEGIFVIVAALLG